MLTRGKTTNRHLAEQYHRLAFFSSTTDSVLFLAKSLRSKHFANAYGV
jgi:hypothetical protein